MKLGGGGGEDIFHNMEKTAPTPPQAEAGLPPVVPCTEKGLSGLVRQGLPMDGSLVVSVWMGTQ